MQRKRKNTKSYCKGLKTSVVKTNQAVKETWGRIALILKDVNSVYDLRYAEFVVPLW